MAKSLDKMMKQLPRKRRAKVEARAAELIAEEMTLRDVRKARELRQTEVARQLHIGQDTVSRLERNAAICCFRPCGASCARWAAGFGWWPSSRTARP